MKKEEFTLVIGGELETVIIHSTKEIHIFNITFRDKHIGHVRRRTRPKQGRSRDGVFVATHNETGNTTTGISRKQAVTNLIYEQYRVRR